MWKNEQCNRQTHEINWDDIICLEIETRLYPRKIIESYNISKYTDKCMNLTECLLINAGYKRGRVEWL